MNGYPALVVFAVISGGLYAATGNSLAYGVTAAACWIVIVWSVIGLFREAS